MIKDKHGGDNFGERNGFTKESYEKKYSSGYGVRYPEGHVIRFYERTLKIENNITEGAVMAVGCETGSFLHYVHSRLPEVHLYGIDVMESLLKEVDKPVDVGIKTRIADISSTSFNSEMKYDAVTMLGVIGIFDDFEPVVDNLVNMTADEGVVYVFGVFNPENLDVIIRSRPSGTHDEWEKGWNVFAEDSLAKYCNSKGWKYEFIEFSMPFSIEKHEGDPLRSWTINMGNKYMVINGLQLIHNFRLLKIRK